MRGNVVHAYWLRCVTANYRYPSVTALGYMAAWNEIDIFMVYGMGGYLPYACYLCFDYRRVEHIPSWKFRHLLMHFVRGLLS